MNKLTIPTILVATVMVAGIFAFMPVEQASTVHTTIQDTQLTFKTTTDTQATVTAGQIITIDLDAPFTLVSLSVSCTQGVSATACAGDEDMDLVSYTVDGSQANTLTITAVTGAGGPGTSTVVIGSSGALAGAGITAADNITILMANDIASAGTGDFDITVSVTVLVEGDTTVAAADIAFT